MFKLYTQAVFERGNTDGFGGFRPKNALYLPKKSFFVERSEVASGRRWAVKVGYKVGYKVFSVVVYQALMRGNQQSSTQPAAALGSSLVVCQARVWTMDNSGGGARRATGWQWRILRGSAVWTYGQCGVAGRRVPTGWRARKRASHGCNAGLRSRWRQGRKAGFRRAGGLPPVGAIWGLADCGGRRFGRSWAFPARAVAPRPSFWQGGRGFAKHASSPQTDAFGRREIFTDFGIWKQKPEARRWRKTAMEKIRKNKKTPPPEKPIKTVLCRTGRAGNGRLGVGNFSQKSGIGKFRNSEIRNPRVEKTAMGNVRENKKTPPLQKIARF